MVNTIAAITSSAVTSPATSGGTCGIKAMRKLTSPTTMAEARRARHRRRHRAARRQLCANTRAPSEKPDPGRRGRLADRMAQDTDADHRANESPNGWSGPEWPVRSAPDARAHIPQDRPIGEKSPCSQFDGTMPAASAAITAKNTSTGKPDRPDDRYDILEKEFVGVDDRRLERYLLHDVSP